MFKLKDLLEVISDNDFEIYYKLSYVTDKEGLETFDSYEWLKELWVHDIYTAGGVIGIDLRDNNLKGE